MVSAGVSFSPATLNKKSKGQWITVYITLPSGMDPEDIDVGTKQIFGIQGNELTPPIPAENHPTEVGDFDEDGIPERMVKFSRPDLIDALNSLAGSVQLSLSGTINETMFQGDGMIRVIQPGKQSNHKAIPTAQTMPTSFELNQNYPNPFNPETTIRYSIPEKSHVVMAIYNIHGDKIRTLRDGPENPSSHTVVWNGENGLGTPVSSGIYLFHLKAGTYRKTIHLLLIR